MDGGTDVVGATPIHGGPGVLGVFNAINVAWHYDAGYLDVDHGSSFVMAAHLVDGDCPVDADTVETIELVGAPSGADGGEVGGAPDGARRLADTGGGLAVVGLVLLGLAGLGYRDRR